ncbi:hypothetical protein D3C80_1920290 [compost metagenome]
MFRPDDGGGAIITTFFPEERSLSIVDDKTCKDCSSEKEKDRRTSSYCLTRARKGAPCVNPLNVDARMTTLIFWDFSILLKTVSLNSMHFVAHSLLCFPASLK